MPQNLKDKLVATRSLLDDNLNKWLQIPDSLDKRVVEAMRYSSIGGGKAFRAFFMVV